MKPITNKRLRVWSSHARDRLPSIRKLKESIRQVTVRCMSWQNEWAAVPASIARCPECGASLEAFVDGWSEGGGYSVDVNCNAAEARTGEPHRYFQSDWQPVMDKVTVWANSGLTK